MKSIISKTLGLFTICAIMLSFLPAPGGEGFEIYLNNKIVIQQYGNDMNNVKRLQLSTTNSNDELSIKYHHCGKIGKNRMVTIKDEKNKVLKEYRFTDVETPLSSMPLKVKDILTLTKGSDNTLIIHYSSSELPKGRILFTI